MLWDLFPDGERLGGAPANFAVHAASLGARSHLISAVGEDARGRAAVEALASRGVRTHVEFVQRPTGTVRVRMEQGGHAFEIVRDVAWDRIGYRPELACLTGEADLFCWGTLGQRKTANRETYRRLLRDLPSRCVKVLDLNFRPTFHCPPPLVRESLAFADILKLNEEELGVLRGCVPGEGGPAGFSERLRCRFGIDLVVVTRGARGCTVVSDAGEASFEGVTTEVVNTVGSGDAFAAVFALNRLAGRPIETCARLANEAGAFVAGQDSGTPELPARFRIWD